MSLRLRRFVFVALLALLAAGPLTMPATADDHAGADRTSPVPMGETGTIGEYEITVMEVTPDATEQMMATIEEMTGEAEPPVEGFVYTLVSMQVHKIAPEVEPEVQRQPLAPTMGLVGERDLGYEHGFPATDMCTSNEHVPSAMTRISPGETGTIEICWQVDADDLASLTMYAIWDETLETETWTWFALGDEVADTSFETPVLEGSVVSESSTQDPISVGDVGMMGPFEVKVVSVNPNATDEVLTLDPANEVPEDGQQYVRFILQVAYVGDDIAGLGGEDIGLTVALPDFSAMYADTDCSSATADRSWYTKIFPGGIHEREVCAIVDSANAESLVLMVDTDVDPNAPRLTFSLRP